MLIRYMGPKPAKTVQYGNLTFVFTPTCEVNDAEVIKFLLHSDRKGLFVPVKNEVPVVKAEPQTQAEPEAPPAQDKKRGRPKKEDK